MTTDWCDKALSWAPPEGWRRVLAVDAHTAGEPLRVILDGFAPTGDSVLGRRRDAAENLDGLRRALMWEPRGHADMYGCVVGPAFTPEADFSVLFTHNEGYSTMCGHGIIGVATVAVEMGLLDVTEPETHVGIDTPAGFVAARVAVEDGRPRGVAFRNVPSFVQALDQTVEVPGLGRVNYDLAFGGAYYAYVDAESVGVSLDVSGYRGLMEKGRAIKDAVQASAPPVHPEEEDLSFLYGTIFVGPPADPANHSRNVCVFADGEVDRSPTGTGVSGRVAIHHARGQVGLGESIVIESILGTTFTVTATAETAVGPYDGVVPEVSGNAFITGRNELWMDPDDPLVEGFFLR